MYHISVDMEPQKQQAFPWENEEQKEEEEEVGALLGRKSRLQANKATAPPPPPPAAVNGEANGGHGLAEGEIKVNHATAAAYGSHKNSHGNASFHQFFFFFGAIIFCYFKISLSSGDLNFLDFINEIIFILWDCVIIIFFLLSLIYCWAAYL